MDDALADVDVEMTHHITPAVTMEANTQWNPSTPNLHIQICIFIHHYGPIIFCYSVIHLTDLVSSKKKASETVLQTFLHETGLKPFKIDRII